MSDRNVMNHDFTSRSGSPQEEQTAQAAIIAGVPTPVLCSRAGPLCLTFFARRMPNRRPRTARQLIDINKDRFSFPCNLPCLRNLTLKWGRIKNHLRKKLYTTAARLRSLHVLTTPDNSCAKDTQDRIGDCLLDA